MGLLLDWLQTFYLELGVDDKVEPANDDLAAAPAAHGQHNDAATGGRAIAEHRVAQAASWSANGRRRNAWGVPSAEIPGDAGLRSYGCPMTTGADQDKEQRNLRRLKRSLGEVDSWLARASRRDWAATVPGSPLAGDDKKADPFHVSHAVASAIHVAVDHADTLRRLIEGCGTCNPGQMTFGLNSYYSLLRGGLENAARAVWLLAPDSRPERILRRLRLQADNVWNSDKAARAMATTMTKPRETRLDRVREIAVRAGLDAQLAVKGTTNVEIIHAAGAYIGDDEGALHAEAIWRACSGAAHGDTWAGLSMHDKDIVSQAGNVATLQMTAATHLLTTITTETFTVINTAHRLFDLRNRSPY